MYIESKWKEIEKLISSRCETPDDLFSAKQLFYSGALVGFSAAFDCSSVDDFEMLETELHSFNCVMKQRFNQKG